MKDLKRSVSVQVIDSDFALLLPNGIYEIKQMEPRSKLKSVVYLCILLAVSGIIGFGYFCPDQVSWLVHSIACLFFFWQISAVKCFVFVCNDYFWLCFVCKCIVKVFERLLYHQRYKYSYRCLFIFNFIIGPNLFLCLDTFLTINLSNIA